VCSKNKTTCQSSSLTTLEHHQNKSQSQQSQIPTIPASGKIFPIASPLSDLPTPAQPPLRLNRAPSWSHVNPLYLHTSPLRVSKTPGPVDSHPHKPQIPRYRVVSRTRALSWKMGCQAYIYILRVMDVNHQFATTCRFLDLHILLDFGSGKHVGRKIPR
jgi:hypothetical protein